MIRWWLEGFFCSKPPYMEIYLVQCFYLVPISVHYPRFLCPMPSSSIHMLVAKGLGRGAEGSSAAWQWEGGDLVFSIVIFIQDDSLLLGFWETEQCAVDRTVRKGRDPAFDFKRMAFVQEATGRQTEDLVVAAQSNVMNARRSSLQAAYNLFTTSLQNDHVLHDKHLAASEVNSQRARSVLVASLEDGIYETYVAFLGWA